MKKSSFNGTEEVIIKVTSFYLEIPSKVKTHMSQIKVNLRVYSTPTFLEKKSVPLIFFGRYTSYLRIPFGGKLYFHPVNVRKEFPEGAFSRNFKSQLLEFL